MVTSPLLIGCLAGFSTLVTLAILSDYLPTFGLFRWGTVALKITIAVWIRAFHRLLGLIIQNRQDLIDLDCKRIPGHRLILDD